MERKLEILLGIYITSLIAAELLGSKFITVLGANISVGIIALPFTFLINDIITEIAGKERARRVVRTGLYMLLLLFAFVLIARVLPPAGFYKNAAAYNSVFNNSLRIIIASLTAFFISEQLDIYVFSRIRQWLKRFLWLRSNASNILSMFVDTTVFIFIAFYMAADNYDFAKMWAIILPYWGIKILFSAVESPLTYLGVWWLRRSENKTKKTDSQMATKEYGESESVS